MASNQQRIRAIDRVRKQIRLRLRWAKGRFRETLVEWDRQLSEERVRLSKPVKYQLI